MRANSHHRPLLVAAVALQRGVATAAAVGPAQARPYSRRLTDKKYDNDEVTRPRLPLYSDILEVCQIGIRALSYRELGCISDMSNSEEWRNTGNNTLVPPRLLDTLLQVYHRRRPTLRLLVLPSVSSFSPTIRRTARISIPPIELNLAERARISAINLDDYQLDPLTPPPSHLSPFSMAAYQQMIDVKPRVEERSLETLSVDELITQLRQMCEDAEDRASNAQEEARQKRKEALEEVVQQIYRNNN
ncbi:hypothetical protein Tco_0010635 [Tanacetum coccineum]